MHVIVFRHGPARDRATAERNALRDADRPLTGAGRDRTRRAADGLGAMLGATPAHLITSPLRRARQTTAILAERLHDAPVEAGDALRPPVNCRRLDHTLARDFAGRLPLLVGHEPGLSTWIAWRLTGRDQPLFTLRRAGAACLRLDAAGSPGNARLCWLLGAAQLAAVSPCSTG